MTPMFVENNISSHNVVTMLPDSIQDEGALTIYKAVKDSLSKRWLVSATNFFSDLVSATFYFWFLQLFNLK